jgi:hypothetical protein
MGCRSIVATRHIRLPRRAPEAFTPALILNGPRRVLIAAIVAGACWLPTIADGSGTTARTCAAAQVKLSLGPSISPMTGEHADLLELTDRFRRSCAVDGYPRISLGSRGRRLGFVYAAGGGPYVTKREPRRITLAPGHRGYFLVAKYRCDAGVQYTVTSMHVSLPGARGPITLSLKRQGVSGLDYCARYPGDQRVDPGNRVSVSPAEPSLQATSPPP